MAQDGTKVRTEVIPEVVFLGKLVERIVTGKIRVPRFQRPFVWNQSDLHSLLDSVLKGFPIGSILVWDTEEPIETTTNVGPVEIDPAPTGVVSYLLDGQQRVSTLVGTLRLTDEMNAVTHQVDWRIYCDLESREFVRAPLTGVEPQYFPVRNLLNTAGFFELCRRILEEVSQTELAQSWLDEADRLANAFRDYQLPLIHIREAELDSAVTVFARLNRTGRKMAADEMVSALTYREGEFHLAEKLDDFADELESRRFGNIDRVLLLRAVLAALDRDIYAKDWADLMVKEEVRAKLPKVFDTVSEATNRSLNFLGKLGVVSDRLLPYGLQLVFLTEFFRLCPDPKLEIEEMLERWFWVTSFTGWFGGVNTAQATHALGEMRDVARGVGNSFKVVDLEAAAQPFPERFDGRSARVRAFLLFLASLNPKSFTSGKKLDLAELLANRGTKALGYISSNAPALENMFSSPANRMFVDLDHAGQTFVKMSELSETDLLDLAPTHGIAVELIDKFYSEDRIGLLRGRLESLIDGERHFMQMRRVTLPANRTAANIADSDLFDL